LNPEIQKILNELEYNTGKFPREAVSAAIANREQIIPELLKIIEHATQNIQEIWDQPRYIAHIYAMFLLAQFREERAYPLIVNFFSIPGEITLDVTGEVVTEDLPRILASVCGGDTRLIKSLVENDDANGYVRSTALRSLLALLACGEKSREEIIHYYQSLFRGKLKREYSFVWDGLVDCSSELYPAELYEDIQQAFQDDLVDPFFIDLKDVERNLSDGKEKVIERLKNDRQYQLIEDTISEMQGWACFNEPKPRPKPQPVVKKKKIGRNEPCPCGSGKKYKKCCLNKNV
jgi:hypothetical protein